MLSQLYPMILQHHLHQQRLLTGHSMINTLCKIVPMHRSLALLILREFYPYLLDNMQIIPIQYLRLSSGLIINLLNCMSCTCTRKPILAKSIFVEGDFNQIYQCYSCTCPFKIPINVGILDDIGYKDLFHMECTEENVITIHENLNQYQLITSNVFVNELLSTELDYVKDLFTFEVFHSTLGKDSLFEIDTIRMIRSIHLYMYLCIVKRFDIFGKSTTSAFTNGTGIHFSDIFERYFPLLLPYYTDIAKKLPYSKQRYDNLKITNPLTIQACEKHELSRRLEIQSWLNRPTTRLGRYSLLMSTIIRKVLNDDFSEHLDCPPGYHLHIHNHFDFKTESIWYERSMDIIKDIMTKVNELSGESENRVKLNMYDELILNKDRKKYTLKLASPEQTILREGPLKRKIGDQIDSVYLLLLGNCLVVMRKKKQKYKISGWPLLLQLIHISSLENVLDEHKIGILSVVGASRWLGLARKNMTEERRRSLSQERKKNSLYRKAKESALTGRKSLKQSYEERKNPKKDEYSKEATLELSGQDKVSDSHVNDLIQQIIHQQESMTESQTDLAFKEPAADSIRKDSEELLSSNDFIIGDSPEENDFVLRVKKDQSTESESQEPFQSKVSIPHNLSHDSLNKADSIQSLESLTNFNKSFEFVIEYLGKKIESITLVASSFADRKAWLEAIIKQQKLVQEQCLDVITSKELISDQSIIIHCAFVMNDGTIIFGCQDGLYHANYAVFQHRSKSEPMLSTLSIQNTSINRHSSAQFINNDLTDFNGQREKISIKKIIECEFVSQVEVIEDQIIFMVDKVVYSCPKEIISLNEIASLLSCKKISSHVSFFKTGISSQKPLVCVVKSTSLSSTIKAYEPLSEQKKNAGLSKFFKRASGDAVKLYRELYIPSESTSIHFLKTKICVGCTKGFEIVDLDSLLTQGLLDPEDENLAFAIKVDNLQPIALYRAHGLFLLCYNGKTYLFRICIFCGQKWETSKT
eukprot:NODE_264_length_11354_cov_1.067170.p1 type:complete len:982 gc:universal NODE_264_length_11354_cov_1.067170:8964-6019(-)